MSPASHAQPAVARQVASVPIPDAAAAPTTAHPALAASERAFLKNRHPQSLAGMLACKQAVAALLAPPPCSHTPRPDVVIAHHDDGAPYVAALPDNWRSPLNGRRLAVSISHTRSRAVAVAALAPLPSHPISLDASSPVAVMTLRTPPSNTMNRAFFDCFSYYARHVLPSLPAQGLVLRGEGRHFSAGADTRELRTLLSTPHADPLCPWRRAASDILSLSRLPYPAVAAVSGCCLGSGLELAMACRCRIATPNALLGLPEADFAWIPGCGGVLSLTRLVGPSEAIRLLLSARPLLARDALNVGLVDAVVPYPRLLDAARRLARSCPPQSPLETTAAPPHESAPPTNPLRFA